LVSRVHVQCFRDVIFHMPHKNFSLVPQSRFVPWQNRLANVIQWFCSWQFVSANWTSVAVPPESLCEQTLSHAFQRVLVESIVSATTHAFLRILIVEPLVSATTHASKEVLIVESIVSATTLLVIWFFSNRSFRYLLGHLNPVTSGDRFFRANKNGSEWDIDWALRDPHFLLYFNKWREENSHFLWPSFSFTLLK